MIRNALLIFGICATIFVVFLPSYLQMQELHNKNSVYERQIRQLSQENEALLEEKRRLEEDPAYFERFAREKFGIIKDGEVIYKIVPAGTAGVPATVNALNTQKSVTETVKPKPRKPAAKNKKLRRPIVRKKKIPKLPKNNGPDVNSDKTKTGK